MVTTLVILYTIILCLKKTDNGWNGVSFANVFYCSLIVKDHTLFFTLKQAIRKSLNRELQSAQLKAFKLSNALHYQETTGDLIQEFQFAHGLFTINYLIMTS